MSDEVMACWQAELISSALEAGEIDEGQALLLAALYFKANWTTRVLADFRAERACEWLGHELTYTRTMQKRLQALRAMGWFQWTYKKGVKLPYDITMCGANMRPVRHRPAVTPEGSSSNTLYVKNESQSTGETTPKATQTVTVTTGRSPDDGGAPLHIEAAALRSAVYTTTDGELLERTLTPSQIDTLLGRHTVAEISYALGKRVDKVRDRRELHRSLRSFLLDGGVQIELDAAQAGLKERLEWANGWLLSLDPATYKKKETPTQRWDRIEALVRRHAAELALFPEMMISGDVGSALYHAQEQEAVMQ